MVFANQAAYEAYNIHPVHTQYVAERWMKEVSSFPRNRFSIFSSEVAPYESIEITQRRERIVD